MPVFRQIMRLTILFALFIVAPLAAAQDAPSAPTSININPNQGRPTITWADDANAEWYQVFVGTPDFSQTLLFEWYEKTNALCNGGTCTLNPSIDPVAGTYAVYIRSWGNDAYSTGGLDGWGGPAEFTLSAQRPENLIVTATNTENGTPVFQWTGAQRATWYYLWVGTLTPQVRTYYGGWMLASAISQTCGNAGQCVLNPNLTLSDGVYVTFMQAWGPGGFSQGSGTYPEWIDGPTFTVGTGSQDEIQVVALLNAARESMGLGCVRINPLLSEAARLHSEDMRDNIGKLDHVGSDGSAFWERIARTGYTGNPRGENIALGYPDAQSVYNGWFNSQGHYDNMFKSDINEIGVAHVGSYWTMVTARRNGVDTACN
ncbi:MAG: hypothetical protein OHK0046_40100 [Anaerolineae bacterium]